jgi:hypothetical protein
MSKKPIFNEKAKSSAKLPIDEPVGDGFPVEKDVSTPPPGSDQEDADDPDRPSGAEEDPS